MQSHIVKRDRRYFIQWTKDSTIERDVTDAVEEILRLERLKWQEEKDEAKCWLPNELEMLEKYRQILGIVASDCLPRA